MILANQAGLERFWRITAGAAVQGLEIREANFFAAGKTLVGGVGRHGGAALYPL